MIRLHGKGKSRWTRPYWALQELGVPFEPVECNVLQGDGQKPEFLKKNPFGKIPVLEDGDLTLFESSAICLYLAQNYGAGALWPSDKAERALCEQWMIFAGGELEAPLWRIARHGFVLPEEDRSAAEIALAKRDFAKIAAPLEKMLGEYAVGNRFTIADVMMAATLLWAKNANLLEDFPNLMDYVKRHTARAKFPKHLYV